MCECRKRLDDVMFEIMTTINKHGITKEIIYSLIDWCISNDYDLYCDCDTEVIDRRVCRLHNYIISLLEYWEPLVCIDAIRIDNFERLEWLSRNGFPVGTRECNVAIYHQRLRTLSYLVEVAKCKLQQKSILIATRTDNQDIIRYCLKRM